MVSASGTAGGGTEYDEARQALRAQHGGAGEPGGVAEALHLIHAVLAGSSSDQAREQVSGATSGETSGETSGVGGSPRSAELRAALVVLRRLREEIAGWEPQLIAAAREHGVSWATLAPALGVTSRQAAERRYLRLRPSATGESTKEDRVQAERTKRAGERAVARWARQNSASLRQLAGQVSALPDLAAPAQYHADRVQQALAGSDPATLLSPLADAHAHLTGSHAALAERINMITEHAEHLRRDTRERRHRPE